MSSIVSHHPLTAAGNTAAGAYVAAAFFHALPAIISEVAGLLTIVFMGFQIMNSLHDWRMRKKIIKKVDDIDPSPPSAD